MTDQVELLRKHYENLSLPTEKEGLGGIFSDLKFSEHDDTSKKLLKLKAFIEKHMTTFHNNSADINIVLGIIDYLNIYGNFLNNKNISLFEDNVLQKPCNFLGMLFYTLYFMYGDKEWLQVFGKYFCKAKKDNILQDLKTEFYTVAIVFEDSDLHSVIDNLTMREKQEHITLSRILVQEPVIEKFNVLLDEQMVDKISYFRNTQEVLTQITKLGALDSVSIWSENIISAKALAEDMQVPLVFINGSEEICGLIVLPIVEKYLKTQCSIESSTEIEISDLVPREMLDDEYKMHYLFYNNMWNVPVKDEYWVEEEYVFAHASDADIEKCLKSARTGFKAWRSLPHDTKKQYLCKFANLMRDKSDARDILTYLETPHLLRESMSRTRNGTVEVTGIREPCGIVVITSDDYLFLRLGQALISGNSVIILLDHEQYKSMIDDFESSLPSGFPSGVLNFLMCCDIIPALNFLRQVDSTSDINYDSGIILIDMVQSETDFAKRDAAEVDMVRNIYKKYTLPKYVLLPIK